MHGFRSHKKHKPDHKKNAIGWAVLIFGLAWFSLAYGQSQKTYFYKPNGTIAGWAEPIPGGNKQAVYDRNGTRLGTIEPPQHSYSIQPSPAPGYNYQPIPGEPADPFAEVPDNE